MQTLNTQIGQDVYNDKQLIEEIAQLAREATVEINVQDEKYLEDARAYLPPGAKIYVSHLPGQLWEATVKACATVRRAGFEPVPHVPVRLIESDEALKGLLKNLRDTAQVREILLISGDYPQTAGPYHAASQILATGVLEQLGFDRVSVAGHPEGHPKVSLEQIRDAEREKVQIGLEHGLDVSLVTQFLFEHEPFLQWVAAHRTHELKTRYVCGLAGPAKISTLLRYAMRCGVGNSIRALNSHHTSIRNLLGDHGPDVMLRELAEARVAQRTAIDGVHMFCFGGFLKTCQWLNKAANGKISLLDKGGFDT